MTVTICDIPAASLLNRRAIDAAFFRDAYRAPLQKRQAGVTEIFHAIFGHHPAWMKFALVARNRVAAWCGLDAPSVAEIMRPEAKGSYTIGDKIGPWPIFALTETELIAGRDNKHLDFRLSILREQTDGKPTVAVSTVCTTHNAFGKAYLFVIIPFHKWGVQKLIRAAIQAGRI